MDNNPTPNPEQPVANASALQAATAWVQQHLEGAADGSKGSRWLTLAELYDLAIKQIADLDQNVLKQALKEVLGRNAQTVRRGEDGTPHTPVQAYCVRLIEAAQ
jgi:hypothetical protein